MPVKAFATYKNNAEFIASVAEAGYLHRDWKTLDPMWGKGNFWKVFKPRKLVKHDLYTLDGVDARKLPHRAKSFAVVVLDPPYKLNGTPDVGVDERYGVHTRTRWQDRHQRIFDVVKEGARVLEDEGFLLLKCQDQVCSGEVRWQTRIFADYGESLGLKLVDRMDMLGGRAQPKRTRKCLYCNGHGWYGPREREDPCLPCGATGRLPSPQVHAERNSSSLLCFMAPR